MTSLAVQFHATMDELVTYIERCLSDHLVYGTAVEYQPFAATPMMKEHARAALECPSLRRVMFTVKEPNRVASGNNELLDRNVGALLLDIGRLGPRGLEESRLSTTIANETWKRIAGYLKRQTKAGAVGVHEQTGAKANYRAHRYSPGAEALAESGISMRPFAQSPVLLHFGGHSGLGR